MMLNCYTVADALNALHLDAGANDELVTSLVEALPDFIEQVTGMTAAEQEHPIAQASLGYMYFMGYGVNQNYAEAAKWSLKAAEHGHVQSQANMGLMYYQGYGVRQDNTEAVKWLRKAAEQGHKDAQNLLIDLGQTW